MIGLKPIQFLELSWIRETNNPNSNLRYKYRLEKAEDGYWAVFKLRPSCDNEESYNMVSTGYSLKQAMNFVRDKIEEEK